MLPKGYEGINQGRLRDVVYSLFPDKSLEENSRKKVNLTNPTTGKFLELDVWLPDLHLGFEFQDLYHYVTTWYAQTPLSHVQLHDDSKKDIMRWKDMDLIVVPCWWDGTAESLLATVGVQRPDLGSPSGLGIPISLNPPRKFFSLPLVPGIGEPMLASFPTSFGFSESIGSENSWWLGEKYDGIRLCWNYAARQIYSRAGLPIMLSNKFVDKFPLTHIDAEIWFGRGYFNESQKVIISTDIEADQMRITTFDSPLLRDCDFETRYKNLLANIKFDHPFLIVVPRVLCVTESYLKNALNEIVQKGGEGVVLRKPLSPYYPGRSPFLLKIKAAQGDREGIVVKVRADKSVALKLPDGKILWVPSNNVLVSHALSKGDIVTFSYEYQSSGAIPVSPKIHKIRTEVTWEEVVRNYLRSNPSTPSLPVRRHGFWTTGKGKNIRRFFEKIALKKNLDPLLPSTWYLLSRKDVEKYKGGNAILNELSGYPNAVMKLFPEIGLDESRFEVDLSAKYQTVKSRRKWFTTVARKIGLEPLVAENWYNLDFTTLLDFTGAQEVLAKYSGNPTIALTHVFPEIGLDINKFKTAHTSWQHVGYMKQFFKDYARSHSFDPFVAKNWYSVSTSIYSHKGASRVLHYYQRSISKALSALFPNIGIDPSQFLHLPKKYWQDQGNRRKLLFKFARENNFDPLHPQGWYSVSRQHFLSSKGAASVMEYHDRNFARTVLDLLPEIGASEAGFKAAHLSHTTKCPTGPNGPNIRLFSRAISLGPKTSFKPMT